MTLPGFDPQYYLQKNPDVAEAGHDPVAHFLNHGWREGRNPSEHFDVSSYLLENPDVAAAGLNPYIHFLEYGLKEGRLLGRMKAELDALSGEIRDAQDREASAVRSNERRAELLRVAQIASAAAIARWKASEAFSAHTLSVAEARARSWAEMFERHVRQTSLTRLPARQGRSASLQATSLAGTHALTLIDLYHRSVGVPGDVLVLAHEDASVPELLDEEVKDDSRKIIVGVAALPMTRTDKDGDFLSAEDRPPKCSSKQFSGRRSSIVGQLDQILASNEMTTRVSLALVDLNGYTLTKSALQTLDELMSPGGFIVTGRDGGACRGGMRAIAEFLDARPETWASEGSALEVPGLTVMAKVA
jgi:hypothetical protein